MTETPETEDQTASNATKLPLPSRQTWPVMLLGAVILLCGMAIGSGATVLWLRDRIVPDRPRRKNVHAVIAARLQRRLNLTDEQTRKVQKIFERRLQALRTLRQDMLPRFEAEHAKLRLEMKEVLTPAQFEQWDARFKSTREHMLRRSGRERPRFRPGSPPDGSAHEGRPKPRRRQHQHPPEH